MNRKYKTMKVFRTYHMPPQVELALKTLVLGEGNEHRALPEHFSFRMNDAWDIVEVVGDAKSFGALHYFNEEIFATYTPEEREKQTIVCLDKLTGTEILKEEISSGLRKVIQRGQCIVSDWLFDNGAKIHEEVIIWYM